MSSIRKAAWSLSIALALASCGSEVAPPKRLDWGNPSGTLPHPPAQSRSPDARPDRRVADAARSEGPRSCGDASACRTPCNGDAPCGGYLCDLVDNTCEISCAFTLTCAPGYLCATDGRCIEP